MRIDRARLLRAATIAVFVAAAIAALGLVRASREHNGVDQIKPDPSAIDVQRAVTLHAQGDVAVRGFLFDYPGIGTRLCYKRRQGSPPFCSGTFVDLYGAKLDGLPFKQGKVRTVRVRWVEQPVTVYGSLLGTALTVSQLSR